MPLLFFIFRLPRFSPPLITLIDITPCRRAIAAYAPLRRSAARHAAFAASPPLRRRFSPRALYRYAAAAAADAMIAVEVTTRRLPCATCRHYRFSAAFASFQPYADAAIFFDYFSLSADLRLRRPPIFSPLPITPMPPPRRHADCCLIYFFSSPITPPPLPID